MSPLVLMLYEILDAVIALFSHANIHLPQVSTGCLDDSSENKKGDVFIVARIAKTFLKFAIAAF